MADQDRINASQAQKEKLELFRKEIGRKYLDGLISDKEYEILLRDKEIELGLGIQAKPVEEKGPECPTCGALVNAKDVECAICGTALMPVLVEIPGPRPAPERIAAPDNWRDEWIDKSYRDLPPQELLKLPPEALKGVSKGDSSRMKSAFNIRTVEDFSKLKFLTWAHELSELGNDPSAFRKEDFEQKLNKDYENKELHDILKAPIYALQGVSESDAKKLNKAFNVKTVEDLGKLIYLDWANQISQMVQDTEMEEPDVRSTVPENWREEWLDKTYRNLPPEELLKMPPDVLKGVSRDDANRMRAAFNIKTLEDFATIKYLIWAQELVRLKERPGAFRKENFKYKLINEYEGKKFDDILKAPTHALQGVSESDARKLTKAFNTRTVEELGSLKYITWAQCIYNMAPPRRYKVGEKVLIPSGRTGRVAYLTEPDMNGLQAIEVAVCQ